MKLKKLLIKLIGLYVAAVELDLEKQAVFYAKELKK